YFSCEDCAIEAARAVEAGGKIEKPKFAIGPYGFISLVTDTEGIMIGLHSLQFGHGGVGVCYCRECRPIMMPSVSVTREMKPYGPIANFGFSILPPASTARAASMAQSSHEK